MWLGHEFVEKLKVSTIFSSFFLFDEVWWIRAFLVGFQGMKKHTNTHAGDDSVFHHPPCHPWETSHTDSENNTKY